MPIANTCAVIIPRWTAARKLVRCATAGRSPTSFSALGHCPGARRGDLGHSGKSQGRVRRAGRQAVLVESPELAKEIAERFEVAAQPASCYALSLGPPDVSGKPKSQWRTAENGKAVAYEGEPGVDLLRRLKVDALALLPIENQL